MWFKGEKRTNGKDKRPVPDGLWLKCEDCGEILYKKRLIENLYVCEYCGYHFKISAKKYIEILTDEFNEMDSEIEPVDILHFKDYLNKIEESKKKSNLNEAILTGEAIISSHKVAFGAMDFNFMGGSMGCVVGEKVLRLIYKAKDEQLPLIIVCSSGGARMQEGIFSLMQMAKTSAALAELSQARVPYISILTNPTTAGVLASFASLADIILAEPKALIGFTGPRVIQQTIKQELPKGFQTAEFLLEHGLIDEVVTRHKLKQTLILLLNFFAK